MKNDFRKQLGLSRQFLELGDVISALDATDVLMRMAEEHGGIDEKLAALLARGTCLVVGDVDDGPAKAILQECVTLSQQNGYWSDYTEAKRMLGMLELKHGRSTAALEHWSSVVKTLLHNAETMPLTEKAEVLDSLCCLIEEVLSGFKPNEDTYPLWFNAAKGLLIAYQALSRSEACIRLAEHILSFQLADEDRRTIDELLGMTLMILGKPQKALSYFEEGLIIAEKTASTSGTLSILQNIAKAHKQTGSYLRALGSLERAEVIMRQPQFDREGYKWLHVNNLIEIASIHRDMANTTAARPYLQAALKAIDSLSPYETTTQIEKAAALTNLGLLDSDEGKHDDAIKVQREALKIHKSGGFTHAVGLAQVETNLALALTDADDVEEAIAHWRESLRLNRQIGDTSRVSRALFYLADLERRRQNNAGCLATLGEALNLKRASRDFNSCSRILFNMAQVHKEIGDYQTALAEVEESAKISNSLEDFGLSAESLSICAGICEEIKDVDRAVAFRKKAAEQWHKACDEQAADREELALIELCLDSRRTQSLERPIEVLDRISKNPSLGVSAIFAKTRLLQSEHQTKDALSTLHTALEKLPEAATEERVIFNINRGVLLGELNHMEEAVDSFRAGLDLIDSVPDLELRGELWECTGHSFSRMKKHVEAYIYLNHALECFRRAGAQSKIARINDVLEPMNTQAIWPNRLFTKGLWEYGLSRKSGWIQPRECGANLLPRSAPKVKPAVGDPDLQAVEEVISVYREMGVWEDPNLGIFLPTIDFYARGTKFRGRTLINPLALADGCLHFFFFRSDPLGRLSHVLDTCLFVGSGNVIFCPLPFLEKLANYLSLGETGPFSIEKFIRTHTSEGEAIAELTRQGDIECNRFLIEWILAHEIGHAALGHPSRFLCYTPSSPKFEQEADDFFIDCYSHFAFIEAPGIQLHMSLSTIILNVYHDYYQREYGHPYTASEWVTIDAPIHITKVQSPHPPLITRLLNLVDRLMAYYPKVDPTDYFARVRQNITMIEGN